MSEKRGEGTVETTTLFINGRIVLPDGVYRADLLVQGEKVQGIICGGAVKADQVVDVSGKVIFPGCIDSHVHMWAPGPNRYREDWQHGTRCAASGGITTVVDMPLSIPPVTDKNGFDIKYREASAEAVVDFAFWGGLTPECIENMPELDRLGCVAYKGFLSFANPDYPQVTDGYLVRGMRVAAGFQGLIGVHAENAEAADFGSRAYAMENGTDYSLYDSARPWWVELEAIQRAVLFATQTGARLLINHMTIKEGAEFLKKAKGENPGIYVETCPHYLIFTREDYNRCGAFAKCNPPLRSAENVEKMWDYIRDGTIDILGSDHGPYTDQEKDVNFWQALSGFGGYDACLPALLTEGYHKRGIPLERLAAVTSGNAAKILGLAPKKGNLLPGRDADFVILDLDREWVYDAMKSFTKNPSKKGLYHGMRMKGRVEATYVRGKLVYDGRDIMAEKGWGQYVPKQK